MSVRVFVASTIEQKQDFAEQALNAGLYNPGWMLSNELNNIRYDRMGEIAEISLAAENQQPVGVAIYYPQMMRQSVRSVFPNRSVICFVSQNQRRKGIGRRMLESFNVPLSEMKSWRGEEQSSKFWINVGTNYRGYWDWSESA